MKDIKVERCKEQVSGEGRFGSFYPHRCSKPIWKEGYCKIHHPESVKIRQEKSKERWEEKRENEPIIRLIKAENRIKKLEEENQLLKDKLEDVDVLLDECLKKTKNWLWGIKHDN
jgi:hypothetical protein